MVKPISSSIENAFAGFVQNTLKKRLLVVVNPQARGGAANWEANLQAGSKFLQAYTRKNQLGVRSSMGLFGSITLGPEYRVPSVNRDQSHNKPTK